MVAVVLVAGACAGCGAPRTAAVWNGRRGYDGNGDYGYDVAASRSEAGAYRTRAAADYPAPGPDEDPWGPFVREAAARFQVPERWIREVMRQESGGRATDADGSPLTSSAGAMGLMQVMPRTYDILRARYGLGGDPYQPHDNILAGAAYIREMYDVYGAPGFLAAYNAGPDRLDGYLAGSEALPDETVGYLASVAPRLGTDVAMTGPLAAYAGAAPASAAVLATGEGADSDRAFDGGGLVTPDAPTGRSTYVTPVVASFVPVPDPQGGSGDWAIQVGAFAEPERAWAAVALARSLAGDAVAGASPAATAVERMAVRYRARFNGLTAGAAAAACGRLSASGLDCFAVPPGA